MGPARLYRDALFYMHEPPSGYHVEGPWRLERAYRGLGAAGLLAFMHEVPAPPPARVREELLLVHDETYVKLVERLAESGGGYLDADTYVGPYTALAGYAVASSGLDALNTLLRQEEGAALILARPPGHHAGRYGAAMGAPTLGFCIFNVSALAAKRAADLGHRVLVVDFDLHHGNGTQEILYDDPRIVHLDLHQDPSTIYPGTGWPWQTGDGEAEGTKINVVVPPYSGDDIYVYLFETGLEFALEALGGNPDVVIVDAGFDAYRGDGLGLLELTTHSYRVVGRLLRKLTPRHLVILEGGYSEGLEKAFPSFMAELLGVSVAPVLDEEESRSPRRAWEAAQRGLRELMRALHGGA